MEIVFHQANTVADFDAGKILFREYAGQLSIDLSFQNFEAELAAVQKQYNEPEGALLLAYCDGHLAGCVGVRKLDDDIAELKRMYVRNEYRGHGIGARLLEQAIQLSTTLGYKKIRLDTLEDMSAAQALYRSFGFYIIPAYRFNPHKGAVYMEKDLM